jgi:hypothetical protein
MQKRKTAQHEAHQSGLCTAKGSRRRCCRPRGRKLRAAGSGGEERREWAQWLRKEEANLPARWSGRRRSVDGGFHCSWSSAATVQREGKREMAGSITFYRARSTSRHGQHLCAVADPKGCRGYSHSNQLILNYCCFM